MYSDTVKFGMPGCVNSHVVDPLQQLRNYINSILPSEPIVLVGGTAAVSYIIFRLIGSIPRDGVVAGLSRFAFKKARLIPSIRKRIETEVAATEKSIEEDMKKLYTLEGEESPNFMVTLPCEGMDADSIINKLNDYMKLGNYNWEQGHVSGTVYHGGKDLTKLNTEVFALTAWTNPLHPDVFPGVCKMEAEIVRICATLFHGGPETVGSITSGGTESIILAVKSYRDYAVRVRGISNPEILAPITVHAAFDKAAELLNMRIRHVAISKTTMQVKLDSMESMINGNTCMIVGSTPAFPHGCIDDIESIAKLGLKYNIPVHVDGCLGGFLLAFMPKAGFKVPAFDFAVEGVTSISADTHKYGYAPKGSSVLLFSDKKYKHQQYFFQSNWPGGIYASPTLAGSRPGVVIAGCWASLLHFGMQGYIDATKKIITATRLIEDGLSKIDGIFIYGKPMVSVVAFGSNEYNIYSLSDKLNKKGWSLNNLQFPASVHICVTYRHTEEGVVEEFLKDVRITLSEVKKQPTDGLNEGAAALYASSQQIPDRSLVNDIIAIYLDTLYKTSNNDDTIGNGDASNGRDSQSQNMKPKRKIGTTTTHNKD